MKKIFIARNRQQIGAFDVEEVRTGLSKGKFLPDDLAWREGLPSWMPLSKLLELEEESQFSTSHPLSSQTPLPSSNTPQELQPAWENYKQLGILRSAIETIRQILLEPAKTFESFSQEGSLINPILFSILIFLVAMLVNLLYQFIWYSFVPNQLPPEAQNLHPLIWTILIFLMIIGMPILMITYLFIVSLITHFFLWIFGAANKNFLTTTRAIFYVHGATFALNLLPIFGGILQSFWALFSTVSALWKAHNTNLWRVILAVFFPLILCCGFCVFGLIFLLTSFPFRDIFK